MKSVLTLLKTANAETFSSFVAINNEIGDITICTPKEMFEIAIENGASDEEKLEEVLSVYNSLSSISNIGNNSYLYESNGVLKPFDAVDFYNQICNKDWFVNLVKQLQEENLLEK